MKYCPTCESEYRDNIARCVDCGVELVDTPPLHCPRCDERIEGESVFCPHCGRLILLEQTETTPVCDTHPDIPAVGMCIVCGKSGCESCLAEEEGKIFCIEDRHVRIHQDYAIVCRCSTDYEASMVRANLAGAGIDARIFSQRDPMYVVNVGTLSIVNVMVPKSRIHEAEEIVRALMTERNDTDEETREGEAE